jgi:hypothetical protein
LPSSGPRPKAGETILIQAGAGGVAGFGVELAKHLGATVIATASASNHYYVRSRGAERVDFAAVISNCDVVLRCADRKPKKPRQPTNRLIVGPMGDLCGLIWCAIAGSTPVAGDLPSLGAAMLGRIPPGGGDKDIPDDPYRGRPRPHRGLNRQVRSLPALRHKLTREAPRHRLLSCAAHRVSPVSRIDVRVRYKQTVRHAHEGDDAAGPKEAPLEKTQGERKPPSQSRAPDHLFILRVRSKAVCLVRNLTEIKSG